MKKIFMISIIFYSAVFAQLKDDVLLSGSLNVDSKLSFEKIWEVEQKSENIYENKKSPLLAGVMSFVVPGAGEFYSESYLKSAVFIALEAAAITIGLIYDSKGDEQTEVFQNYANDHWSVERYAKWTITNASSINSNVNPADYNLFDGNGKVIWKVLNQLELDLGGYYSHRLPYKGDQQYYEMIGKYPQFNPGWDDFGDENTPYVYGDPLTGRFIYYSKERGKANDFYNIASKAVLVIVANHIISALDAAWTANRFNKNLELSAEIKKSNLGYETVFYTQLNLKYNF